MKKLILLLICCLIAMPLRAIPPSPPAAAGAGTGDVLADGTVPFTGNVTLDDGTTDSPSIIFKDSDDETFTCVKKQGAAGSGYYQCTSAAGDGFQVLTGNLKVGNGTPGQTINGEDAYIEGLLEVDGVFYPDGGINGYAIGTDIPGISGTPTDEQLVCWEQDGTAWKQKACGAKIAATDGITFHFDGGGSEIADNKIACTTAKFAMTITSWTIIPDQSGSIKIDIWKDTYANGLPTNADTITNAHEPEISSAAKAQDIDLADWTTVEVAAGDIVCASVDSATTITWANLVLAGTRK